MARKPPLSAPELAPKPEAKERPAGRAGKRAVAFWIDPVIYEEFVVATVRLHTTIQNAGDEMLADWMLKHGFKVPER